MAIVVIKDLEINRELDKKALANTKGGWYSNYYWPPYNNFYNYYYPVYPNYPAASSGNIGSLLAPFNGGYRFF